MNRPQLVNWQSALYALALGITCVFLIPLTRWWWLAPALGVSVPLALALVRTRSERAGPRGSDADADTAHERELLRVLAEAGSLNPVAAALRTSLTVDQASVLLDRLAQRGHLCRHAGTDGPTYTRPEPAPRHSPVDAPEHAPDDAPPERLADPLSARELEVLRLLATGLTTAEVARELFVSVGTVKSHTGNIYRKLDARNRAEAIARARRLRLLA